MNHFRIAFVGLSLICFWTASVSLAKATDPSAATANAGGDLNSGLTLTDGNSSLDGSDNRLPPSAVSSSPEVEERIRRCDMHFNKGRQLYFEGNYSTAREEFDQAVDALLNTPENLNGRLRLERHLDEVTDRIYRFDLEKLGAGEVEEAVVFDKAPIDEISHMTFTVDPGLAPKVKNELTQTVSGIPLELSDPVLSFIHYFSTENGKKTLLSGFRRAGRYKAIIQRILAEEGVPQDLIYLAQAESGFLPRAVSNKQAMGMWQFVYGTGIMYDLNRTSTFDERFDLEKATRAAARHLRDLHQRYSDWYLAMAAYNCGKGNVDKAVERTGHADYWELLKRHALPKETANYVPIIVAITIMAKNPQDYGLQNIEEDAALEFDSLQLEAPTNLNLIADAVQQPVSVIHDLNPSLLRNVAPAGIRIHVPKGAAATTQAALASVPAANREAWRLHHVETGDTLATIAEHYHTPAKLIASANRDSGSLEAGNVLIIPATYREPRVVKSTVRSKRGRSVAQAARSRKASGAGRAAGVAATRRISSRTVALRKSAVHTASLRR